MKNFEFLFAAYMVIWVLIGGYVLNLGAKLRKLEKREEKN